MFLNSFKYRQFIGQSEHVFKKVYFSLSHRPENLGLKIWFKTPIFCLETFEKKPYLLPTTIRHTPGTNKFIFKCVVFCGGSRRFFREIELYAYNFTPHSPVVTKVTNFSHTKRLSGTLLWALIMRKLKVLEILFFFSP
jgi:hypothetical protein